jgi:hypothetical protein
MIATDARMSTLDGASLCAERGLHVIPVWRAVDGKCACPPRSLTRKKSDGTYGDCVSPGKHPSIDAWQTAASIEPVVLRDWFGDERFNIGVVCGLSNVAVIDIDPRNGGQDSIDALIAEIGPLPATVTADSGGGGTHYVYRRPTGDLISKFESTERKYPGVDLLRDGRQFLVEPSLHASGKLYRWRPGHGPDEIQIASLPEAWVKRIRRQVRRTTTYSGPTNDARADRARKYLAKLPPAVSGDGGHTQMFNAVAIAMFGFDLDDATTLSVVAEYNQRCDPPFSDREIAHKLKSVAADCNRPRGYLLDANREPIRTSGRITDHDAGDETDHDDGNWAAALIAKRDGTAKKLYCNTEVFVRSFPDYRGRWALNTMTGEPWFNGSPVRETFIHALRGHVEQRLGFTPTVADIKAAIMVAAEHQSFHPVRRYLDSIDWDGQPRLAGAAREHLGAEAPLHAEMVRRWMIGAVARALRPGCKLDTALLLHGRQGLGKSTFFAILGSPWHSDSTIDISNKDAYQQIHSAWLYEFSELENVVTGRAESRLKAFMTSTHDSFRAPYAAAVTNRPRSVALCGTTNRREILTDDTGSRRFWIVPVDIEIDRECLTHARDHLWAEARAAFEAGEPWWFDRQLDADREAANEDYETEDVWSERLVEWLASPGRAEITIGRVLEDALKIELGRQDRAAQMRVAKILKKLGWHREREGGGERQWRYLRPGTQAGLGFS